MAIRAIPNLWFVRPADANEVAYAWKIAMERKDGPVLLAMSRQKLPVLDRSVLGAAAGVERGAYILWEAEKAKKPELILIATGSEVAIALEAAKALLEQGVHSRVVSMPCWELFEEQSEKYRESVLPSEVTARLGRGRDLARLAALGRQSRRFRGDRPLRRLGPRRRVDEALRLHGRERREPGAGATGTSFVKHSRRRGL